MANMVPQNPDNNRGVWAKIEAEVRSLVMERGELYVITGPIFDDENRKSIGGAVGVPEKLFKALFDPAANEVMVYLLENRESAEPVSVSLSQIESIAGLKIFPGIETRAGIAKCDYQNIRLTKGGGMNYQCQK